MAPAERPDVIVDFTRVCGEEHHPLQLTHPPRSPAADARTDFFPGLDNGNPVNANTPNGFGPNTRVLMRFNVVAATGAADPPLNINTSTDLTPGLDPFLIDPAVQQAGVPAPPVIHTRFLTLNEYFDEYGRLIQILGNDAAPFGSPYVGTATYLDDPPANAWGPPRRMSMPATRKCGRSSTPPATCTRCTSTW